MTVDRKPGAGPKTLSATELERYGRQLRLPQVGLAGQQALAAARILVVGAGGLGSPVLAYLAAAGIGTLGIAEFDVVSRSNLQRQVLYDEADVGLAKVWHAKRRLQAQNPGLAVEGHDSGVTPANAARLVTAYDLVVDCSDNFGTRYLLNDACRLSGRPLVHASIFQFEGQVTVFAPQAPGCYRCLFPAPPEVAPNCADGGVLGVLAGTIGTLQATEALKVVLGIGRPLVGRLLVYDALALQFQEFAIGPDPACPLCGPDPTIGDLSAAAALVARFAPQETEEVPDDWELRSQDLPAWEDFLILDVQEHGAGTGLPNARRVPLSTLAAALATLTTERPILACCLSGESSKTAVRLLRAAGFTDSWSLRGGALAIDPGDRPPT